MLRVMCTFVPCDSTPGVDDNDLQVVRVARGAGLGQRPRPDTVGISGTGGGGGVAGRSGKTR
jgi:hypothetical protein